MEVRIKYTDQDEKYAVSLGDMSLTEAKEFFDFFHFMRVEKRNSEWKAWLKQANLEQVKGLNFMPVVINDDTDDGDGGPQVYGFIHATLRMPLSPEEGGEPHLLLEYLDL